MFSRSKWALAIAAMGAATVSALITLSCTRTGPAAPQAPQVARTPDGKPDFSGIWQANNEAHWDLQAHEARPGAVTQPGVYPYEYARVPAAPVVALASTGVGDSLVAAPPSPISPAVPDPQQ